MSASEATAVRPGGHILLVDDDVALVRALRLSLQLEGYRVSTVARSVDALGAVVRLRPDLVILDVMMPGIDGWQVLRAVRADPSVADTPIMMLTAKDSEKAKYTGFTLGADDYLTKPFSLVELRCRVAALLRRSAGGHGVSPEVVTVPVMNGASGQTLIAASDIYYVEGIRNYAYVHTYDTRHLSRHSLGELQERLPSDFARVHRSFIVNLSAVRGCGWATRSSFRLRLGNLDATELPVSRTLVSDVRSRLGVR